MQHVKLVFAMNTQFYCQDFITEKACLKLIVQRSNSLVV